MEQTKQKKKLVVIAILVALLLVSSVTSVAFAQPVGNDDFDIVFWETTKELYVAQTDEIRLTANKEVLLDMNLAPLGYVYDFSANGEKGFAIIISIDNIITVTEFAMGQNPYADVTDNRVYASYLVYLRENNGDYYIVGSNNKLSEAAVAALSQNAYKGTGAITYSQEYVYFTSKDVNRKNLALRHPYVSEVGGLSNACAPIAGANLIQYWDRFHENLIPNFTSYSIVYNQCVYKGPDSTVQNMTRQVYADMQTNVTAAGTTETQFKNGLQTYCARQGYGTVTYNTCMSGRTFNYDLAKQRIDAGQPLAIFVDTFTVAEVGESTNGQYDFIDRMIGDGCHVMAGFGYKEVSYVLTDGTHRTDHYLAVAAGFSKYDTSYFNVYLNTQIDDVFGVVIS